LVVLVYTRDLQGEFPHQQVVHPPEAEHGEHDPVLGQVLVQGRVNPPRQLLQLVNLPLQTGLPRRVVVLM
jgi:hypothetical protein